MWPGQARRRIARISRRQAPACANGRDRPAGCPCAPYAIRGGAPHVEGDPWMLPILAVLALFVVATPALAGVIDEPCPPGAIALTPGVSIQAAADRVGAGAAFCVKNGVHRMQVVRPKQGQSFHGEGHTVLNGSRLLTTFSREGRYWVASGQEPRGGRHGECTKDVPACGLPDGFFI